MDQVCLCCRLIMGWIRFSEGERKFDCISSPNSVSTKNDLNKGFYHLN